MRRHAAVTAVALAVGLAACGGQEQQNEPVSAKVSNVDPAPRLTTEQAAARLGLVEHDMGLSWIDKRSGCEIDTVIVGAGPAELAAFDGEPVVQAGSLAVVLSTLPEDEQRCADLMAPRVERVARAL